MSKALCSTSDYSMLIPNINPVILLIILAICFLVALRLIKYGFDKV